MGKVAAFIDDVIVGMEDKEGHDELVAEIIKRLEENDLYVKPEKCKWKVVFTTPEGLFELIVIFFQLMNSLAMFQTMMNKILNDLINTRKVMSFIENVIIGMEEEEEHDEIVEKIVKRLAENDLYMKLEKCK